MRKFVGISYGEMYLASTRGKPDISRAINMKKEANVRQFKRLSEKKSDLVEVQSSGDEEKSSTPVEVGDVTASKMCEYIAASMMREDIDVSKMHEDITTMKDVIRSLEGKVGDMPSQNTDVLPNVSSWLRRRPKK